MWSPAQSTNPQFWLQFLEKYKSFRFLWDTNDRSHTDRGKRQAAYEELAEMAKTVMPEANVLYVRHRINSLRTCFRRENKKVSAAEANGISYKPTLFYYEMMKQFLLPEETDVEANNVTWEDNDYSDSDDPFSSTQSEDNVNDQIVNVKIQPKRIEDNAVSDNEEDNFTLTQSRSDHQIVNIKHKSNRDYVVSDNDDPFCNVTSTKTSVQGKVSKVKIKPENNYKIVERNPAEDEVEYSQSSDESVSSQPPSKRKKIDQFDQLGKRIANHFRNMDDDQCLIAEKIVTDVCFFGRMRGLTVQTALKIDSSTIVRKC